MTPSSQRARSESVKFDMGVFIKQLEKAGYHYGCCRPSPRHGGNEPPEDQTAARVIYAIADALKMATDDTKPA